MKNKTPLVIAAAVVLAVVIIAVPMLLKGNAKKPEPQTGGALQETSDAVPTVDPSVKVDLKPSSTKKEVTLSLAGIPAGTASVDYELSYEEKTKGLQGVIGVIPLSGQDTFEKKITLGTCSSGRCVYHEVVGKIKLSLKFSGSYGDKMFEKEYDI